MALLKSYTCSKCAGVLIFDSDQSYFDCPFCGTKFNVADFHGAELLSQAASCLAQNDFNAARDKYNTVLEHEPDNFEALRGLILSEAGLPSPEWLCNPTNFKKNNISSINKFIENAKARTKGAEASYFNKLSELVGMVSEIKSLEKERYVVKADASKGKFKRASSQLEIVQRARVMGSVIFGLMILMTIFSGLNIFLEEGPESFIPVFIATNVEIAVYTGYMIFQTRRLNRFAEPIRETVKIGKTMDTMVSNNVAELNKRFAAEYNNLLAIQAECGKAKDEAESDSKAAEETAPAEAQDDVVADPSKTVLCAKCGAQLALNNEKRVYECNSCGVAYGISLFFGLPMEKALLAMNQGNYSDAEKRFTNILMVNPSDFEALLGRILCKGRWPKVSGIDASDELTPTAVKVIQKLVTESGEQARPEDKPYFELLNEVLSKLAECSAVNYKINMAQKKLGDFEAEERVYAAAKDPGDKSSNTERMILNRDLREYSEKKTTLDRNFEYKKGKLLRLRSDSVLAK